MRTPARLRGGRDLGWLVPVCLVAAVCPAADAPAGNAFLSLRQRGELVWHGRVSGTDGGLYDVRACPGYTRPTRYAGRHWGKAWDALSEYGRGDTYRRLAGLSGTAYAWGFGDCLQDFAISGSRRAWTDRVPAPGKAGESGLVRRVLRCPWAATRATMVSAVRLPVGLGGALLGACAGTVAIPGYVILSPGSRGVYEAVVHGAVVPGCGYAWNSVVTPAMALIARRPAPGRTNSRWVRRLASESDSATGPARPTLNDVELEHLATWALCLHKELRPYADEREQIARSRDDRIREINREAAVRTDELYGEERERYERLLQSPAHRDLLHRLGQGAYTAERLARQEEELQRILRRRGLGGADLDNAIRLLHRYPMKVRIPGPSGDEPGSDQGSKP